jgi:hypothetical protein
MPIAIFVQECDPDKKSGLAANEVPHSCCLARTILFKTTTSVIEFNQFVFAIKLANKR